MPTSMRPFILAASRPCHSSLLCFANASLPVPVPVSAIPYLCVLNIWMGLLLKIPVLARWKRLLNVRQSQERGRDEIPTATWEWFRSSCVTVWNASSFSCTGTGGCARISDAKLLRHSFVAPPADGRWVSPCSTDPDLADSREASIILALWHTPPHVARPTTRVWCRLVPPPLQTLP